MSEERKRRKPGASGAPRAPRPGAPEAGKAAGSRPRKAKPPIAATASAAPASSHTSPPAPVPVPTAAPPEPVMAASIVAAPEPVPAIPPAPLPPAPLPPAPLPPAPLPPAPLPVAFTPPVAKVGRRYSRFVSLMKVALPVAALALIAAVVAWPGGDTSRPGALPISFANIKIDPTGLTMQSPRFVGVDKQGQAYTVTAVEAIQDKADAERVDLTSPEADISVKSGGWFHLQATTGIIRPKLNTIDLNGVVELYSGDGWEAHGSAVSANMDEGTARSDLPVTGQGPAGTISADRFEAWDGGNRIRFMGNVRMTVMPSARS